MIESILKRAIEKVAYKYALQNAYFHNGKANVNAVVSHVYGHADEIIREMVNEIVNEVNKLSLEEQKKELEGI